MADGHMGYSQPIGGVVGYDRYVSPSGVGYDIACGNKAVRTDLCWGDIRRHLPRLMDRIWATIPFGTARKRVRPVDHELFDDPIWRDIPQGAQLHTLARKQFGTVGGGNHFVDLLVEITGGDQRSLLRRAGALPERAPVWVAVHFGSRGLGHQIATNFLGLATGRPAEDQVPAGSMENGPTLIPVDSDLGQAYLAAMHLAGRYAYAGRDQVVDQVLDALGARATFTVHNHHNFAWLEEHGGRKLWVIRKGATPLWPGQLGFIGGSMGDISVVVRGVEGPESALALYSTMHGAGRVMSRTRAAGRWKHRGPKLVRAGGAVHMKSVLKDLESQGIELRGGGPDEAPAVYRRLGKVLPFHSPTFDVLAVLRPVGVAMAPPEAEDPYRD
jgi:tRNA-splicing ligase RtcB